MFRKLIYAFLRHINCPTEPNFVDDVFFKKQLCYFALDFDEFFQINRFRNELREDILCFKVLRLDILRLNLLSFDVFSYDLRVGI